MSVCGKMHHKRLSFQCYAGFKWPICWFGLLVRAFGSSFWFGLLAHPSFVRSRLPKGTVLQREMTSGILVSEQCNNIGNRVCPGWKLGWPGCTLLYSAGPYPADHGGARSCQAAFKLNKIRHGCAKSSGWMLNHWTGDSLILVKTPLS